VNDYDDKVALILSDAISAWRWAAAYGAYVPEGITVPSEVLVAAQCARQNYASMTGRDFLFDFDYYRAWDAAIASGKVPVMDMMRVVIQDCQHDLDWADLGEFAQLAAVAGRQRIEPNKSLDTLTGALRCAAVKGYTPTSRVQEILRAAGVAPNAFTVRYWIFRSAELLSAGFSPSGKRAALGLAVAEAILSE